MSVLPSITQISSLWPVQIVGDTFGLTKTIHPADEISKLPLKSHIALFFDRYLLHAGPMSWYMVAEMGGPINSPSWRSAKTVVCVMEVVGVGIANLDVYWGMRLMRLRYPDNVWLLVGVQA
jgi:hypothetical protein